MACEVVHVFYASHISVISIFVVNTREEEGIRSAPNNTFEKKEFSKKNEI